jgi:N-acetylmuramoyl-L-alanine amidase
MTDLNKLTPIEVLSLTIYGEARGEPIEGQVAVGSVIRNRTDRLTTYSTVCLKPKQFSCWNSDDVNYSILTDMADKMINGQTIPEIDYQQCLWVANGIYNRFIKDNTNGAKNYMTVAEFHSDSRPRWAKIVLSNPIKVGRQVFFNV